MNMRFPAIVAEAMAADAVKTVESHRRDKAQRRFIPRFILSGTAQKLFREQSAPLAAHRFSQEARPILTA